MRAFAIAAVATMGLSLAGQAHAADLGGGPSYGRSHGPSYGTSYGTSSYSDGPYYVTPRGDGNFYADCTRPRSPDAYGPGGPDPNSEFFGPLGYRCVQGTYAYLPVPSRCHVAYIKTPHGWQRKMQCF
jgi:hypothetical protein